jgi:hypothetical protein
MVIARRLSDTHLISSCVLLFISYSRELNLNWNKVYTKFHQNPLGDPELELTGGGTDMTVPVYGKARVNNR